jgi:hypothetical protein
MWVTAAVWIKYSFFCDTTQCSHWQWLKCPIRKKILDRWNDYVLWNRQQPNTSDAVPYPRRTNTSCLRILFNNEFYVPKLQVMLSEKYFQLITFIDARIFVRTSSALLSHTVCVCVRVCVRARVCMWTLPHQSHLHGCDWCYTHMQLLSEMSVRIRRMCNRANSKHFIVKNSTFTDLPIKKFYVITVNSYDDDDHESIENCLEIKCKKKKKCTNYFCTVRWYILLLLWLYVPCRINFQASLFLTIFFQSKTPIFCK